MLHSWPAVANPQGGVVAAGNASISAAGPILTIQQASNRAVINWQGFSIGANEATRFLQPSAAAAVLNRVTGGNPSQLLGQLSANGQVYLINPNGIVVGPQGRIDTGGFVASTLNLSDAAFMQGGPLTFQGGSDAGITVLGSIAAAAGDVVLAAHRVDNRGRIEAPGGQAILAAGRELVYLPDGQSDIVIKAAGLETPMDGAAVDNSGTIAAASVQLKAAGSAHALAVNNGGLIHATGLHRSGGRILLDGGAGDIVHSASLSARNGDAGGSVTLAGGRVTLGPAASVDVSAPAGGGRVAIGGGAQGAEPAIRNAQAVSVAAGAHIRADATQQGDGGAVTVWSDGPTAFAGSIGSRGGPAGGNGGEAEVSGRRLAFSGTVDLTAPRGATGHFLLDPEVLDIDAATATAITAALLTANETVSATTSIAVNAAISSPSANMLAFSAPTVQVNADLTLPNGIVAFLPGGGAGVLLRSADGTTLSAAEVRIAGGFATVEMEGAVQTAALTVDQAGSATTTLDVANGSNSIGSVVFAAGGNTYAGNATVFSQDAMTVSGSLIAGGRVTLASGGNLTALRGTALTAGGIATLASIGGIVMNQAGSGLFAGGGRRLLYTSTDTNGFSDGGLDHPQFDGVLYDNDPQPGEATATYINTASGLPVLTIAATDASRVYGQADPAFGATFAGGDSTDLTTPVSLQVLEASTANAGSYTIAPYGAVSTTRVLRYVDGTLAVEPAPLTITAGSVSRTYGDENPAFSASYAGLVNGDTTAVVSGLGLASAAVRSSGVGSYAISPTGGSAANYAITRVDGTLTVGPASLTIAADSASRRYGSSNPALTASYAGLVNGDTAAVVSGLGLGTTADRISAVGAYPITVTGGTAVNYSITRVGGILTVEPAPLTITARGVSRLYGADNPAFSVTYSGLVTGEGPSVVSGLRIGTTATSASGVGGYPITPAGGAAANYAISHVAGTLTVEPAPLTIAADNQSRLYGADNPAFTASYDGLVNGDTASVVAGLSFATASRSAGVGSYTIQPVGAISANYDIATVDGTLTVEPAPLTIGVNDAARYYGEDNPPFTLSYSGLVNGDTAAAVTDVAFFTPARRSSDAGSYLIGLLDYRAVNYAIAVSRFGRLTVSKAPLTIRADDASRRETQVNPVFTASYAGLVNGDSATAVSGLRLESPATVTSPTGSYPIMPGGGTATNYDISYVPGTLTVMPKVFTATVTTSNIYIPDEQPLIILEPLPPVTETILLKENFDPAPHGPIVLDPEPVLICFGCPSFGNGPQKAEIDKVIAEFVATMADATDPPVTVQSVRAALVDRDEAPVMLGTLLPFLYANLANILAAPESEWTPAQAGFVQAMQTYIETQRKAAAQQAMADYEAWALESNAKTRAQLDSMPDGAAKVIYMQILSTNPPIPPLTLLQTSELGLSMTAGQMGTYAAMAVQSGKVIDVLSATGETGRDLANFIPGAIADVAKLAKLVSADGTLLAHSIPAVASVLTNAARQATRLIAKATQTIADASATVAEIAEAQALLSKFSKGLETVDAITDFIPVVGLVVELVANVIQAGIAIAQYAQISDFNAAFAASVEKAQQTVSIAEMRQMMSGDLGKQQMMSYLAAMAATNGNAPPVSKPTRSLGEIITIAGQL